MVKKVPLVTVILPHFNCENYLHEAVSSILSQVHQDFELKVIDDASSTNRWIETIRGLVIGDDRVKLLQTSKNVGPYRIKNKIIEETRSPYIAFQDADDRSHPLRFSRQISLIEERDAHIVGSSFNYLTADGRIIGRKKMPRYANFWMKLGRSYAVLHASTIVRRDVFDIMKGFDGTTFIAADSDFFLRAAHIYKIINTKENLYDYRMRNDSLSSSSKTGRKSELRMQYVAAMLDRERQRRYLAKRDDIFASLVAPSNDIEFEIKEVSLS